MRHEIVKLLDFGSQNTYYTWKKEQRPIIGLLEKYFTKEDLQEFLESGKIQKQELIKDKSFEEINKCFNNSHNEAILAQIEELKKQLK